jgi:ribonuclease III
LTSINFPVEAGQNIVSRLSSNNHLATIGKNLGLERCINPNPSQKDVINDSLVADTVEAIIGAVFLDGGLEASERVMEILGVLGGTG